jgi:DNA uptake protein ComE-like DNA-binding protein
MATMQSRCNMFKKLIFVIAITLASSLNALTSAQNTADSERLIDLNRASVEQLAEALDGVGIARARTIFNTARTMESSTRLKNY